MGRRIFIDTFSGAASDLKGRNRTPENVFEALKKHPRVSCFDMCENPWLVSCINELKHEKKIEEVKSDYPWLQYKATTIDAQLNGEANGQ